MLPSDSPRTAFPYAFFSTTISAWTTRSRTCDGSGETCLAGSVLHVPPGLDSFALTSSSPASEGEAQVGQGLNAFWSPTKESCAWRAQVAIESATASRQAPAFHRSMSRDGPDHKSCSATPMSSVSIWSVSTRSSAVGAFSAFAGSTTTETTSSICIKKPSDAERPARLESSTREKSPRKANSSVRGEQLAFTLRVLSTCVVTRSLYSWTSFGL
mmetsp:Transcript_7599/g.28654  ORF Transcript_7599/g.28654 Transcript_7599/m.28654 type:complete len:214 (-) Transcript_7599:1144-1785(-)